jgi:hypothetical protein
MTVLSHAKKRASQRYGINLDGKLHNSICREIKSGKAERICKSTNTRTIYRIEGMIVVYSKTRNKIITVLPINSK